MSHQLTIWTTWNCPGCGRGFPVHTRSAADAAHPAWESHLREVATIRRDHDTVCGTPAGDAEAIITRSLRHQEVVSTPEFTAPEAPKR